MSNFCFQEIRKIVVYLIPFCLNQSHVPYSKMVQDQFQTFRYCFRKHYKIDVISSCARFLIEGM